LPARPIAAMAALHTERAKSLVAPHGQRAFVALAPLARRPSNDGRQSGSRTGGTRSGASGAGQPWAGIALSPRSAYLPFTTGNGQWASVAESGFCSRLNKEWERHMPQSYFSHAQETIRDARESRRECADFVRRGRAEFAETRAATLKAIAESRELMAKIDAVMAKVPPQRGIP
jgi:hypothetical protein